LRIVDHRMYEQTIYPPAVLLNQRREFMGRWADFFETDRAAFGGALTAREL
jgi:hypothetical protein